VKALGWPAALGRRVARTETATRNKRVRMKVKSQWRLMRNRLCMGWTGRRHRIKKSGLEGNAADEDSRAAGATESGVSIEDTQTQRATPSRVGDAMEELRRAATHDETGGGGGGYAFEPSTLAGEA
jgi:hypothetical protein